MQSFIENAEEGLFFVNFQEGAPFKDISDLLDKIRNKPELMHRLNSAYTKNLVYKDSFASGKGGKDIDEKRVLDLSPERLAQIRAHDPEIISEFGPAFERVLAFWHGLRGVSDRLLKALGAATGNEDLYGSNVKQNLRLVDYFARPSGSDAPRCGTHRDFGQMTVIFPSSAGLEIFRNNAWVKVATPPAGAAICLFGICTSWRSNDRLASPKHRVDPGLEGRRISAVIFFGPDGEETLTPIIKPGERPIWKTGVVKEVRPYVARKWKGREGTVSQEEANAEEELKKFLPTQDDSINYYYKINYSA